MLDFEKKIVSTQDRIDALSCKPTLSSKDRQELHRLEKKKNRYTEEIYSQLTPWQKVQVSRHTDRPQTPDYVKQLITQWTPLCGDRIFGEDRAVMSGIGLLKDKPIMVIGHDKGVDTETRIERNFGMAHPEGYRKARRLVHMADRFSVPVLFLVDTKGAYMGKAAEERGQAQAIAECIDACLTVNVPIMSVIIGEGGSGGAVAFGCGNYIGMLEHATYSVISPEGCASILWKSVDRREDAAKAQKVTAAHLHRLGVIDEIISEPIGGAHRHAAETIDRVGQAVYAQIQRMDQQTDLAQRRKEKFLRMGRAGA